MFENEKICKTYNISTLENAKVKRPYFKPGAKYEIKKFIQECRNGENLTVKWFYPKEMY